MFVKPFNTTSISFPIDLLFPLSSNNLISNWLITASDWTMSWPQYIHILYAPNLSNLSVNLASHPCLVACDLPNCTTIANNTFQHCSNLMSINIPNVLEIPSYTFYCCKNLLDVNVENCTIIGSNAFYSCSMLSNINLPNCSIIQSGAFARATNLSAMTIGTNLSFPCSLANSSVFNSTPMATTGSILVPYSLVSTYKAADGWSYFANRIFPISVPSYNYGDGSLNVSDLTVATGTILSRSYDDCLYLNGSHKLGYVANSSDAPRYGWANTHIIEPNQFITIDGVNQSKPFTPGIESYCGVTWTDHQQARGSGVSPTLATVTAGENTYTLATPITGEQLVYGYYCAGGYTTGVNISKIAYIVNNVAYSLKELIDYNYITPLVLIGCESRSGTYSFPDGYKTYDNSGTTATRDYPIIVHGFMTNANCTITAVVISTNTNWNTSYDGFSLATIPLESARLTIEPY